MYDNLHQVFCVRIGLRQLARRGKHRAGIFDIRRVIAYIAAVLFAKVKPLSKLHRHRRLALGRAIPLIAALVAAVSISTSAPVIAADADEPNFIFSTLSSFTDKAARLAIEAMSLIGIHYRRGGNTPENGLDCSGLVRYVFREAHGTELPRTSFEISKMGETVDKQDLQPGDLVFFNTLRRTFSHVGIYLGDNKFIHAPSSGGAVRIESMDLAYWKARFNGARRIETTESKDGSSR